MAVIPGMFRFEKCDSALDGFLRRGGGDFAHFEIVRAASHGADEFGASCFYSSYAWHVFQCTPQDRPPACRTGRLQ